jgi:hypothetical protein
MRAQATVIRHTFAAAALLVVCGHHVSAQDARVERQTVRSGVEAVQLVINVKGKDGEAPKVLKREDFRLTENGIEQTLTQFLAEQPSATMSRFTLGYTSSTPKIVRKIEVKVRGFRKRITRTLQPETGP